MTTQNMIDEFLHQRRIAIVGVSRDPCDYSRTVFRKFLELEYDAVPVNPNTFEVDGAGCWASVDMIHPAPTAALLLTSHDGTLEELAACAEAGIEHIWSRKHLDKASLEFCEQNGMSVIDGYCPFMFFPDSAGVHKLHGMVLKVIGSYPGKEEEPTAAV